MTIRLEAKLNASKTVAAARNSSAKVRMFDIVMLM